MVHGFPGFGGTREKRHGTCQYAEICDTGILVNIKFSFNSIIFQLGILVVVILTQP